MTLDDAYRRAVADGRLTADPAQVAALPALERVRADLSAPPPARGLFRKAPPPPRGVYLWGGVGRGKSMLMDLLFSVVDAPKDRQHFHAFMQSVHAGIAAARATGHDDPLDPVAHAISDRIRFLAFDEMQITDITDAMLVGRLFEKLFAAGVTIVSTSNRPPDDLYRNGLNRALFLPFIALLKDRMEVVELSSVTDHRQGRIAGTQTWFSPINADSRAAIAAVWTRLTHGAAAPLVLRVTGRDVVIPAFHNGAARAGFYELCGRPLGPADYLALAHAIRLLVLEDIPQMGPENYNAARRFVTLIDALYEGRVRLIASAATAPELLYTEGEGTFEFERTASRLREMQSVEWAE